MNKYEKILRNNERMITDHYMKQHPLYTEYKTLHDEYKTLATMFENVSRLANEFMEMGYLEYGEIKVPVKVQVYLPDDWRLNTFPNEYKRYREVDTQSDKLYYEILKVAKEQIDKLNIFASITMRTNKELDELLRKIIGDDVC